MKRKAQQVEGEGLTDKDRKFLQWFMRKLNTETLAGAYKHYVFMLGHYSPESEPITIEEYAKTFFDNPRSR